MPDTTWVCATDPAHVDFTPVPVPSPVTSIGKQMVDMGVSDTAVSTFLFQMGLLNSLADTFTSGEDRELARTALVLSATAMTPPSLKYKPADTYAFLSHAKKYGFSGNEAFSAFYTMGAGKITPTAATIRALLGRAGYRLVWLENTPTRATCVIHGPDRSVTSPYTVTMKDAEQAGWVKNANYNSNPAAMLRARASSAAGMLYYPDIVGCLAAADDQWDTQGNPLAVPAEMDDLDVDALWAVEGDRFIAALSKIDKTLEDADAWLHAQSNGKLRSDNCGSEWRKQAVIALKPPTVA